MTPPLTESLDWLASVNGASRFYDDEQGQPVLRVGVPMGDDDAVVIVIRRRSEQAADDLAAALDLARDEHEARSRRRQIAVVS